MGYIVECSDHGMPVVRAGVPIRFVDLGAEVAQDEYSGLVSPSEKRPHDKFKVFHHILITVQNRLVTCSAEGYKINKRRVVHVQLNDHKIRKVRYVVRTTVSKVCRICSSHGSVCELGSGVWEDRIPPSEENGRVASW
jgi:hypothetical protein